MPFAGFSPEALRFLERLGHNNDRDWFEAHRGEYEEYLLEPARELVGAMGEAFDRLTKGVHADPRTNRSIRRLARDTRFAKDKRPYKTHLDLWFWQGEGPSSGCPGFWFRLWPESLILGAGMHRFDGELLARYRDAVSSPKLGARLAEVTTALRAGGVDVGGKHYKRVPAGFSAEGEQAELLLHDGLFAWIETPVPAAAHTAAFPGYCIETYGRLLPLQEWLVELTRV